MIIKEYGNKNKEIIILLHGGGLSWWNYIDEIELLKNDYRLIIPILDGHFGSDKNFISIEVNAKEIINFIDNNFNGKVKLICGLSLGGQIALEIMSQRNSICDYAIIESALVYPMKNISKLVEFFINMTYKLISNKIFSKLQFKSLRIRKDLFEFYYNDTSKITKENLVSFMKANLNYKIKESLRNCKIKTLILAGSKERQIIKNSAYKIKNMINLSELEILEGYYHGDISINYPKEYVGRIKKLFEERLNE